MRGNVYGAPDSPPVLLLHHVGQDHVAKPVIGTDVAVHRLVEGRIWNLRRRSVKRIDPGVAEKDVVAPVTVEIDKAQPGIASF